jgi:hypothetical protein
MTALWRALQQASKCRVGTPAWFVWQPCPVESISRAHPVLGSCGHHVHRTRIPAVIFAALKIACSVATHIICRSCKRKLSGYWTDQRCWHVAWCSWKNLVVRTQRAHEIRVVVLYMWLHEDDMHTNSPRDWAIFRVSYKLFLYPSILRISCTTHWKCCLFSEYSVYFVFASLFRKRVMVQKIWNLMSICLWNLNVINTSQSDFVPCSEWSLFQFRDKSALFLLALVWKLLNVFL